jgi:hypothetical protein
VGSGDTLRYHLEAPKLAGCLEFRPLSTYQRVLADGVGFEPTRGARPLPVFKTGAFNRSATHPRLGYQLLRRWVPGEQMVKLAPNWHPGSYHDPPSPFKAALIASAALVSALANMCA